MITELVLLGSLPAILIVSIGLLILRFSPPGSVRRQFILYLLIISVVLLLIIFVAGLLKPISSYRLPWEVSYLLIPSCLGVMALSILKIGWLAALTRLQKGVALLLGLGILGLLSGMQIQQPGGVVLMILPGVVILALVWFLVNRWSGWAVLFTALAFAQMGLVNWDGLDATIRQAPTLLAWPIGILMYIFPVLTVVLAAYFLSSALSRWSDHLQTNAAEWLRRSWVPVGFRLLLSATLLGCLAYTVYWATIWDQTSDGLGGVFYAMEATIAAIGAGMVMTMTARSWQRTAGIAYTVLIPVLMIAAFGQKWAIYKTITEGRAARIQQAIETFHQQNGTYPSTLSTLVPRYLLWVPKPVILRGEGWCYQGGEDYYRLGTFYRDIFSLPLEMKIYASTGTPPQESWACDQELADLKKAYDPPPFMEENIVYPTAVPQPTSAVPVQKIPVQPLLRAKNIQPGSWSPEGRFFVFALPEIAGDQRLVTVSFYDAQTGELCQAPERYPGAADLRDHHAWLPDGRLLFLSITSELILITPCSETTEKITGRFTESFVSIASSDEASGWILLQSKTVYWLLNGGSLEASPISGIQLQSGELNRDRYAWSPGGGSLAVSQAQGTKEEPGGRLMMVQAKTGEILQTFPLPGISGEYAPMIDWLDENKILLSGSAKLSILDLASTPPQEVDVFKDIFGLNLKYPDEVSSLAWVTDPATGGYHIAVRASHPRDQSIYLYHPETGKVENFAPESDAILFFPGGKWEELRKMPAMAPVTQDRYELYWVDQPERQPVKLVVAGHTPRNYPNLSIVYEPGSPDIFFCSSQGVSQVSFPDGKLEQFWSLEQLTISNFPYLLKSPGYPNLLVVADGDGLYSIPLSP